MQIALEAQFFRSHRSLRVAAFHFCRKNSRFDVIKNHWW